jgi:hypothetical protein
MRLTCPSITVFMGCITLAGCDDDGSSGNHSKPATSLSAQAPQEEIAKIKARINDRAPAAPAAKPISQLSGEEAMAAFRKFMVGTWTYTGTELNYGITTTWIK